MKDKTILIGGCSFSESQKKYKFVKDENSFINHVDFDDKKHWYPWTDMLDDEYGRNNIILNEAKGSSGQGMIVSTLTKKLFELNFDVDMIIVQWSNPSRMFTDKESDIVNSIHIQGIELLSYKGIDIFTKESKEKLDKIGFDITFNSLNQIYLFKNLLERKKIPYIFFWGWNQNIDYIKYNFILNQIYNDNFMIFNKNKNDTPIIAGGMHDYANIILGCDNTEVDDGHPNTRAHRVFYTNIIKNIVINKLKG